MAEQYVVYLTKLRTKKRTIEHVVPRYDKALALASKSAETEGDYDWGEQVAPDRWHLGRLRADGSRGTPLAEIMVQKHDGPAKIGAIDVLAAEAGVPVEEARRWSPETLRFYLLKREKRKRTLPPVIVDQLNQVAESKLATMSESNMLNVGLAALTLNLPELADWIDKHSYRDTLRITTVTLRYAEEETETDESGRPLGARATLSA